MDPVLNLQSERLASLQGNMPSQEVAMHEHAAGSAGSAEGMDEEERGALYESLASMRGALLRCVRRHIVRVALWDLCFRHGDELE